MGLLAKMVNVSNGKSRKQEGVDKDRAFDHLSSIHISSTSQWS